MKTNLNPNVSEYAKFLGGSFQMNTCLILSWEPGNVPSRAGMMGIVRLRGNLQRLHQSLPNEMKEQHESEYAQPALEAISLAQVMALSEPPCVSKQAQVLAAQNHSYKRRRAIVPVGQNLVRKAFLQKATLSLFFGFFFCTSNPKPLSLSSEFV